MPAARPQGVRVPTDLSRYADWTTWLAEQGATDPDVRVEHSPWRHDFGLRYLHKDLTAGYQRR